MKPCHEISLPDVLLDSCDAATESEVQSHLDNCHACQQQLQRLAANQQTWVEVADHLSTADQLRLSQSMKQKLADTSAFLIAQPSSSATRDAQPTVSASPSLDAEQNWSQVLDPPKHPEMLGQIDHFEIESKIGQGGMGIVLKGFDRELDRAVAIKVLAPHLACNGTARKRFAREAQAAAAVVHPNVVPIYSVNQSVDRPYIAMQLVPGRSLQSVVEEDGPLQVKSVVRIAIQIADGLAAAHDQGLIHRDVKPANVLTERDVTRVMITDFGLARAVDDVGMTQTGWLTGTPHYMSPEQAKGEDIDPRSDLFSLGSLLYFLATGREPFRAERSYGVIQKIINEQPLPANAINSDIPPELTTVIDRLLAKDRVNRFQSASETADLLRDYLAYLQQPNQLKPPIKAAKRGLTLWSWAWLTTFILIAAAAFALFQQQFANDSAFAKSLAGLANIDPQNTTDPQYEPPNPETSGTNLTFDDDAFLRELKDLDRDIEQLEQQMGIDNPEMPEYPQVIEDESPQFPASPIEPNSDSNKKQDPFESPDRPKSLTIPSTAPKGTSNDTSSD
ncbi:MAG: serine/threonine-protein kinase [Planctomycetota bacterium]